MRILHILQSARNNVYHYGIQYGCADQYKKTTANILR